MCTKNNTQKASSFYHDSFTSLSQYIKVTADHGFKNILTNTRKWKTLNAEDLCKMEVCSHVLLSISIIQFAPPHQETMYLTKNRLHPRSHYYNKIKSTMSQFQFRQPNQKITHWYKFLFFSCISEIWPSITDNSF